MLATCGFVQGITTGAMILVAAVAAPFALTAVTVASFALTVGVFAAPAVLLGIGMTAAFSCSKDLRRFDKDHPATGVGIQAGGLALLSAAVVGAAAFFGLLSFPLLMTMIVASAVVTLLFAGLATWAGCHSS